MSSTIYLALFLFLVVCAYIWWYLPRFQTKELRASVNSEKMIELEDEIRKTVTNVLGGAVLILSAAVAYQQLIITSQSAQDQFKEAARKTNFEHSNTLLSTAYTLLGKNSAEKNHLAEHIGGIDLLLAWVSEKYSNSDVDPLDSIDMRRQMVADTLIAFVRDQTQFDISDEKCDVYIASKPPTHPASKEINHDVQVALSALVELSKYKPIQLKFRGLNLSRADLSHGHFNGSKVAFTDLSQAKLGDAVFSQSDFYCSNLFQADINHIDFSSDRKSTDSETSLIGADLTGSHGADIKFQDSDLADTKLKEVKYDGVYFDGTRLENADFYAANMTKSSFTEQTDLNCAHIFKLNSVVDYSKAKNAGRVITSDSQYDLPLYSKCRKLP